MAANKVGTKSVDAAGLFKAFEEMQRERSEVNQGGAGSVGIEYPSAVWESKPYEGAESLAAEFHEIAGAADEIRSDVGGGDVRVALDRVLSMFHIAADRAKELAKDVAADRLLLRVLLAAQFGAVKMSDGGTDHTVRLEFVDDRDDMLRALLDVDHLGNLADALLGVKRSRRLAVTARNRVRDSMRFVLYPSDVHVGRFEGQRLLGYTIDEDGDGEPRHAIYFDGSREWARDIAWKRARDAYNLDESYYVPVGACVAWAGRGAGDTQAHTRCSPVNVTTASGVRAPRGGGCRRVPGGVRHRPAPGIAKWCRS